MTSDSNPNKKLTHALVLAAIIVAALLRIGLFALAIANPERTYETDTGAYLRPALALLQDGYYSYPDPVITPTYPALIAIVYGLFGANPLWLIAVQVFLGVGTIYLTYRTGLLLGISRSASILAALLLSLSLETLLSPFLILSETLFTFLLTFTTFALVTFLQHPRWIWLVSASLLSGLAILCRPVAVAYEAVVVALLLLAPRVRFWKRALHAAVYLVLVISLFILPWVWRNKQVLGVATFTTKSGDHLLYWVAAPLYADVNHVSYDEASQVLRTQVDEILFQRGIEQTDKNITQVKDEVGTKFLYAHLVQYAFLHVRYDLQNFLPGIGYAVHFLQLSEGNTQGLTVLQSQGLGAVIENYFGGRTIFILIFAPFVLLLLLTYIGTAAGVVEMFRKRNWMTLAVLVFTAGYFLLAPGYASDSRYRIPAMPFIVLFSGVGLTALWNCMKTKWRRKAGQKTSSGLNHD